MYASVASNKRGLGFIEVGNETAVRNGSTFEKSSRCVRGLAKGVAMPYEGELLNQCPGDLDFSVTQAVVVSGASWNPCGHMMLCAGNSSDTAWYFHVAGAGAREAFGVYAFPKFMREKDYHRYLCDNGKHEIRRLNAQIVNPSGAYRKLTELMISKWCWKVLPDNCATFVKEIVKAGGGNLDVTWNCPDQEVVRSIKIGIKDALDRAAQFQMENRGPKW
jgi:hypothetical protein